MISNKGWGGTHLTFKLTTRPSINFSLIVKSRSIIFQEPISIKQWMVKCVLCKGTRRVFDVPDKISN